MVEQTSSALQLLKSADNEPLLIPFDPIRELSVLESPLDGETTEFRWLGHVDSIKLFGDS